MLLAGWLSKKNTLGGRNKKEAVEALRVRQHLEREKVVVSTLTLLNICPGVFVKGGAIASENDADSHKAADSLEVTSRVQWGNLQHPWKDGANCQIWQCQEICLSYSFLEH